MFRRMASDMSEAPGKPEDQPSGQPQPDEEEPSQLRGVPEDELRQLLEAHDKWVLSDGKDGEQADLSNIDLFQAVLMRANLQGAKLRGASLEEANLQGATLIGAKGLTPKQLENACGDAFTKLPPGLSIKPCPKESK